MEEQTKQKSKCPNCSSVIYTDIDYPIWCKSCSWGIIYENQIKSKSKWEEFYQKISLKYSQKLFTEILKEDLSKKKTSFSVKLALFLSVLIILTNVSLLIAGISLLFLKLEFLGFAKYLISFVFLGLFILTKPKLPKMPKQKFVSQKDFPSLYKMVNIVCKLLGTSEVTGIIIDDQFNASISEYGFSRKKVLHIGLPLWSILTNKEKVYLIGHEISHCTNGDPARGLILYVANNILIEAGLAIYPDQGTLRSETFIKIPVYIFLSSISHLFWYMSYVLCQLVWFDSQRSEYLADLSATKVGGKRNSLSGMEKLAYFDIVNANLEKKSLKSYKELDNLNIFQELKDKTNNLPENEKDRLRRILELENHRLDATHPPTFYRIKMIKEKGTENGMIEKESINFDQINKELKQIEPKIQKALIDKYKNRLYY